MRSWINTYAQRYDQIQKKKNDTKSLATQLKGFVYSGIPEIDQSLGGIPTGEITAFIGKSKLLSTLFHRVCVKTVNMFHSPIIVIDAQNQLNPFLLARLARFHQFSSQELLKHVYLSRAYTVYQLTDLIHHHVEPLITQIQPVTIILTGFFSLFTDSDLSKNQTVQLSELLLKKIKQLTTQYQIAMILIDTHSIDYDVLVFDCLIDTTVQIQDMRHCPRMTITQKNQQVTVTSETVGQLCLQDFGMVI